MRNAVGWVFGIVTALCVVLGSAAQARAAACGDANRTGTVTVTDGVLVLRAAAQLSAICPRERCDMNIDGGVSVTDGVLALRVAAGVQTQVACSASQADVIFGQIVKNTGAGRVASPAARARAAGGTTTPCSGGGFVEETDTILTFVECKEGDFITDGTLLFSVDGEDTVSVLFSTHDFVVSTGETTDTAGILTYVFGDEFTRVDGVLFYSSSVIGSYTEEYSDVRLDADFFIISGNVDTVVTEGLDLFANVATIGTIIYSPTLARITVEYVNGEPDVFTLADGLCEPCSGGCANGSLACISCVDQCGGGSDRCGVDFDMTDCDDGLYGPAGLCDPCTTNAECNQANGLSCFACDGNCTGSTLRCGSSIAFIECEDGFF